MRRRQDWKKLCKIPSSHRGLILTYDVYTFFVMFDFSLHLIALLEHTGTTTTIFSNPPSCFSLLYDLSSGVHVEPVVWCEDWRLRRGRFQTMNQASK